MYRLACCSTCGTAWVVNADDDYAAIYNDAYYAGKGADPLVNYVAELADENRSTRRYEWEGLRTIAGDLGAPATGRWIDFGGGAGAFARFLSRSGFDAFAYDTGHGIEIAKANGVPVASAAMLDAFDGTVDVVSAIEVLEHVRDPVVVMDRMARLLRPGGVLIITTGNVARRRGPLARWSYLVPEVHITFFSPSSLALAFRQAGLEPISVARSRGWDSVIRYKVLKNLGINRRAVVERVLPWRVIGAILDRLRGVSEMPAARKPWGEHPAIDGRNESLGARRDSR